MSDSKEALNFPDFTPVDHARRCPNYTAILNRRTSDSVTVEEIDGLQQDLETLLVAAARQMRLLKTEIQNISVPEQVEVKKEKKVGKGKEADLKRTKSSDERSTPTTPTSSSKRAKLTDSPAQQQSKHPGKSGEASTISGGRTSGASTPSGGKISGGTGKTSGRTSGGESTSSGGRTSGGPSATSSPVSTPTNSSRIKLKGSRPRPLNEPVITEPAAAPVEESVAPQPPQTRPVVYDTPNKFWQSVEPYCAPIHHGVVRMLEQMAKPMENYDEYLKVPELGMHFSKRWELEDIKEEHAEGKRCGIRQTEKPDSSVKAVMQKSASALESTEDSCPFGSLTQRLLSSFVEQNIMAPPEHAAALLEAGKQGASAPASTKPLKAITASTANRLEAKIRAELIEQGILESDSGADPNEDEILTELIRTQQELRAVSSKNRDVIQQLIQAARDEMLRVEIQKKISTSNIEVIEQYKRVMAARQKKRQLSKKEKEIAWKALKDRDSLVKQLESL